MKKYLLIILLFLGTIVTVFIVSMMWWRFWMYDGIIGPIPILHWLISSDGEFSYDLTLYEMFLHNIVIALGVCLAFNFKRAK
jgi:hypothetical protein